MQVRCLHFLSYVESTSRVFPVGIYFIFVFYAGRGGRGGPRGGGRGGGRGRGARGKSLVCVVVVGGGGGGAAAEARVQSSRLEGRGSVVHYSTPGTGHAWRVHRYGYQL